jgi:hypothetical protein
MSFKMNAFHNIRFLQRLFETLWESVLSLSTPKFIRSSRHLRIAALNEDSSLIGRQNYSPLKRLKLPAETEQFPTRPKSQTVTLLSVTVVKSMSTAQKASNQVLRSAKPLCHK